MTIEKEISRKELQILNENLDVFDQTSKTLTKQVIERITDNKFAMLPVIEAIQKYSEKVREEFEKTTGTVLKEVQAMDEADQKKVQDDMSKYFAEHKGFNAFLDKKIKVEFTVITKADMRNCEYKPSILFTLIDYIFFKEKPDPKAKPKKEEPEN